ncbi:hypothetical protein OH76DRAFT_1407019 [Lentinus brumalis]|uniref:Uncharacterized protein n=1 Tax=Lentinus brumalis TaxID=2498619 RepID=A0A371D186_9APHY|nr:hypothetical protein OH76DRAFT_1407019 [Polyporus brumalis]
MTTERGSRVPLEVLLLIIDIVGEDSSKWAYPTLRACALTCRSWRHRARIHLFRRVTLTSYRQYRRFENTVFNCPDLGRLVEELHCDLSGVRLEGLKRGDPLLFGIIDYLRTLRSLTVFGDTTVELGRKFPHFVGQFARCKMLRTFAIRECTFQDFDDLARAVWSLPEISTINLEDIYWHVTLGAVDWNDYPTKLPKLTRLELNHVLFLDPALEIMDTGAVEELKITSASPEDASFHGIMRYTRLRKLELVFDGGEHPWIEAAVSKLTRSPEFEELVLCCNAHGTPREAVSEHLLALNLDSILSDTERGAPFPVRTITVDVHTADPTEEHGSWTSMLQGVFSRSHQRGVLRTTIHEWKPIYWRP